MDDREMEFSGPSRRPLETAGEVCRFGEGVPTDSGKARVELGRTKAEEAVKRSARRATSAPAVTWTPSAARPRPVANVHPRCSCSAESARMKLGYLLERSI